MANAAPDWLKYAEDVIRNAPSSVWDKAKGFAEGLPTMLKYSAGLPPPSQMPDPQQVVAAGKSAIHPYTSWNNFKTTFRNDPARPLLDAATLLSGGEGLAARGAEATSELAPALSRALSTASKVSGNAAGKINPLALPAKIVAPTVSRMARAVRPSLSPAAIDHAVAQAYPNGEIKSSDLDPNVLKTVVGAKGQVTPAVIKQVVAQQHGVTPTRTMVTGQALPRNMAPDVSDLVQNGHSTIAAKAHAIGNSNMPSIGEAFENAQLGLKNAANGAYKKLFSNQGTFGPDVTEGLAGNLDQSIANSSGGPKSLDDLSNFPSYTQTRKAKSYLLNRIQQLEGGTTPEIPYLGRKWSYSHGQWTDDQGSPATEVGSSLLDAIATGMKTPADKQVPVTLGDLESTRQELNQFRNAAKGADQHGVSALINGFDQHLQSQLDAGKFSGDAAQASSDLTNARSLYKSYFDKFRDNPNPVISGATKALEARQGTSNGTTSPAVDDAGSPLHEVIQKPIINKLVGPNLSTSPEGALLHNDLSQILAPDNMAAVNNGIRNKVTQPTADQNSTALTDATGKPLSWNAKPDDVHTFLNGPMGGLFNPDEQSTLRTLAESKRMLINPPTETIAPPSSGWSVGNIVGTGVGATAGRIVGGHLESLGLPFGTEIGEAVGMPIGYKAERAFEGRGAKKTLATEIAGAPEISVSPQSIAKGALVPAEVGQDQKPAAAPQIPIDQPQPVSQAELDAAFKEKPKDTAEGEQPASSDEINQAFAPQPNANGGRIERASGGKVGHQHLVERLMKLAEDAKKQTDKATEPLLKSDDSTIAHALAVAQKAI